MAGVGVGGVLKGDWCKMVGAWTTAEIQAEMSDVRVFQLFKDHLKVNLKSYSYAHLSSCPTKRNLNRQCFQRVNGVV